jgi:putative transcriptional regulator
MYSKIKGYRNMLNMTQEELASKFGITKQSYSNKERGRNEFSDKEKIIFKELLQPLFPTVTIDDIFF